MRFHRFVLGMLVAAALVYVAPVAQAQESAKKPAAKAGTSSAANINLPLIDLDGYNKLLAKYKGKPLLVTFWATWCEPCRDEFPTLVALSEEYRPKGLAIFGVNLDNNADMNLVRHFLAQYRPDFPSYRQDPQIDVDAFYHGVNPQWRGEMPLTMFYTRDGRIAQSFVAEQTRATFEQAIRSVLGQQASSKAQGASPRAGN